MTLYQFLPKTDHGFAVRVDCIDLVVINDFTVKIVLRSTHAHTIEFSTRASARQEFDKLCELVLLRGSE